MPFKPFNLGTRHITLLINVKIDLDGRYADIMELSLYNTVLTSMSYDGKRFTYVNQLASSDTDLSQREEWFTCVS